MKVLLKHIRCGLTSGVLLIHYWFWYFLRYSRHPEKYPIEKRYAMLRKACVSIIKHFRADLIYSGVEYLQEALKDERGLLIVSNHLSIFDMLTLMLASDEPITFIAKKELKKTPLLGKATMALGSLFLDRDDPRQAIEVFRKATEIAKNGGVVGIYPEGTRNKDPLNTPVQPFHPGSFKVSLRGEANILCISSFGTFRYLAGPTNYRSNPIYFQFHKMVRYEDIKDKNTTQIAELCHQIVNEGVEEQKKLDAEYIASGRHKKKAPKWWKTIPHVRDALGKK